MVTTRNSRQDVVAAAGRMFADKGYHGTSMRDIGKAVGLLGSSLYSHIDSKEDLLVEVVDEGARLFLDSASRAIDSGSGPTESLKLLIAGHVDVVLDHPDVVRTYLNEARMLDRAHRSGVVAARDEYESVFRSVIRRGVEVGALRGELDPKLSSIFILSILNALERWYQTDGEFDRTELVEAIWEIVILGLSG